MSLRTCVACKTTSDSYGEEFYTLLPCNHTICSECYTSPLTLISCYGCTACGKIPSGKKKCEDGKSKSSEEKVAVEKKTTPSGVSQGGSNDEATTGLFSSPSSTLDYLYSYSTTASTTTQSCDYIPPAPTKTSYTNCTQEPLYASIPAEITTTPSYKDTTLETTKNKFQPYQYYFEEEEEGQTSTLSNNITSEVTSDDELEDDSSCSSLSSENDDEGDESSGLQTQSRTVVVVPKGCPDNQRPRRSSKPTRCEEHGKLLHRCKPCRRQYIFRTRAVAKEAAQEEKFTRGRKEELRRVWMTHYF